MSNAGFQHLDLLRQRGPAKPVEPEQPELAPSEVGAKPDTAAVRAQSAMSDTKPGSDLLMWDRASQATVIVPIDQAEGAFRSGRYHILPGQRIPVTDPETGAPGMVEAEHLSDAINAGARIGAQSYVDPDVAAAEKRAEEEANGLGGMALSAFSGAVESVGGLADILTGVGGSQLNSQNFVADLLGGAGGLGGQAGRREELERIRRAREAHPIAGALGGVAGLLVPGGATTKLGGAVEHGVERLVGKGAEAFVTRAGQKAAALGARGIAEGIALGGAGAVSEATLGDIPLTAERIVAGMGHGALWGGIGGAVGGVAGEALGTGWRALRNRAAKLPAADASAVEAVAKKRFGWVPEGLGDRYVKMSAGLSSGDEAFIREAGIQNQGRAAKAIRSELLDGDELRKAAARDVREHVDGMLKATRELTDEAKGSLKKSYVQAAVKDVSHAPASERAWQTMTALSDDVNEMLAQPRAYGAQSSLRNMRELVNQQSAKALAAIRSGDTAEVFVTLDDTKRAVGRWTKSMQAIERTPDPLKLAQGRATRDRLEAVYERMRTGLEDESVWGRAAQDQRAINAAWSKQIDAGGRFDRALTTEVGRDPSNPWRSVRGVDPAKADAYVKNLTNPNNDLTHQAVRDYVESSKSLADTIGKSYALPPEKAAQVAAARKAADSFGKVIAGQETRLARANQLKELLESEKNSILGQMVSGLGGMAAGAALGKAIGGDEGMAIGGMMGGGLGLGARLLARPGAALMHLAQVERMAARTEAKVSGAVGKMFTRAKEVGGAAWKETKTARTLAMHKPEPERAQYAARVSAIRAAQSDPSSASDHVSKHLAPLASAAPETARASAAVAARAMTFLATKVPAGQSVDSMFSAAKPPRIAASEVSRFNRYWRAVDDPVSVLDDMRAGKLSREGVEAVRAVYPKLYETMRTEITDRLATEHAARREPTYQQKVQLGMLFGVASDKTLTQVPQLQATFAQAPPEKPNAPGRHGTPKPLVEGKGLRTTSQALEAGR